MLKVNDVVRRAWKAGFAIPAFNVPYLPMIEPVIRAVVDADSFAMVETARLEWIKFEARGPEAVAAEFHHWHNPRHISLHLDHIPVIDEDNCQVEFLPILRQAVMLGYHSIMVDGSRLSLDENIRATRAATEIAHQAGVPCEAELGAILGHESGPMPPYDELFASGKGFTQPEEAARFVRESGCDWLSVAIGNIHGAIAAGVKDKQKIAARLDLDHLTRLRQALDIPLVLHGGSGIPRELVLASFQQGIAKINIATEIRQAYETTLRESTSIPAAQEAVYQKTRWLVEDYFNLGGIASLVVGEQP
ncbi:MAG: class II fructose-bisphosphate aldolase [Anaerolineae bacterium]|nr:class II fructose-bisphosphate aldolase [Anaerolineae bacterium]